MKLLLMVLSLIAASASKAVKYENLLAKSEVDCHNFVDFGIKVIFHFFKDQHYLAWIDTNGSLTLNSFECTGGNVFRPILVYSSLKKVKFGPEIQASSVTSLPTTDGYFIRCTRRDLIENFLPRVAAHNPKTKLLIRLIEKEANFETAREILKIAFEQFKMLYVLIILNEHEEIRICLYNPFSGKGSMRSPTFSCTTMDPLDLSQKLAKVDKEIVARVTNLQEHPLKIHIFPYPMVSQPVYNFDLNLIRYEYADGLMVQILAEKMNFTQVLAQISSEYDYAFNFPNGTVSGSLAALENDEVDLLANARLITVYRTKKAVFMHGSTMRKFAFIIQKRERSRFMRVTLLNIYDTPTKIVTLIFLISFPLIFHFVKTLEAKVENRRAQSFAKSFLYVTALQNNIAMKQSKRLSTRLVTVSIVFYALIITSVMQGTIVKSLNKSEKVGEIKTIDGLLDHNYELLIPYGLTDILRKQSGSRLRDVLRKAAEKDIGISTDEGIEMLHNRKDVAFLWSKLYGGNFLNQYFDPITGENLFEMIPETAFEFYIATMAPKASPFIEKMNEIIHRYIESGLSSYSVNLAIADNDKIWYQRLKDGLTPKPANLSIKCEELLTAFKLFIGATLFCILVFCAEIGFCFFKNQLQKSKQ